MANMLIRTRRESYKYRVAFLVRVFLVVGIPTVYILINGVENSENEAEPYFYDTGKSAFNFTFNIHLLKTVAYSKEFIKWFIFCSNVTFDCDLIFSTMRKFCN